MQRTWYKFLGLIMLAAWLPSCATVEKPEIKAIDEKPKISKTVQQERSNIDTKKG